MITLNNSPIINHKQEQTMESTIYELSKLDTNWFVLRCYVGFENSYELIWSYQGTKDSVNYEYMTC